jgi:glycosyltransferase involved in cell wall biosynthesis
VVAFSSGARPRRFVEHATFYLLPAVPIRQLRYLLLFLAAPLLGFWCVARHRVDVVVAQSPYEGCAGAWIKQAARLLLRRPVALVVESHGDFERALFLQRQIRRRTYAPLMRAAARMALRHADALRAISDATRIQLQGSGGTQPLVQFPTWSDLDVFLDAGCRRSGPGDDVLYAGVMTPLKGVHHLVAAFAKAAPRSPGVRLVLVGGAPDTRYRRQLERQARELGIAGAVRFVPPLPQSELAERMAAARVLVLPSLSEGLGRVLFEAMAAGAPVIGTAVGGIPELVRDGVNGFLVAPGDEDQLADRLVTLLHDPGLSGRLGAAGRAFAVANLSTAAYFDEYVRLFDLAVASSGGWS